MAKETYTFEDFLNNVSITNKGFVEEIHNYFLNNGCKIKIELAKSGYVVSYLHTKTKKTIINFVFRKDGLVVRIYGDNVNKYINLIQSLPDNMTGGIKTAPVCKRLIDPTKCNSRCPQGYDFELNGDRYQKCRYSSFMFLVNDESIPFIKTFVESELNERAV